MLDQHIPTDTPTETSTRTPAAGVSRNQPSRNAFATPAESLKAANALSPAKANADSPGSPISSDRVPPELRAGGPAESDPATNTDHALELSLTQILGSTGAAVTAAFLGSRLGVAGTLIGAALASVISVVGGALYTQSLKATRQRMAKVITGGRPAPSRATRQVRRRGFRRGDSRRSSRIGGGLSLGGGLLAGALAACVFAGALVVVTGYESVSGAPLSGGPAGGLTVLGGHAAAPGKETGTSPATSDSPPSASSSPSSSPGVATRGPSTQPTTGPSPTATSPAPGSTGTAAGTGSLPAPGSGPFTVGVTPSGAPPGLSGSVPPTTPANGTPRPVTTVPVPGQHATSTGAGPDSNLAHTSAAGAAPSTPLTGMFPR